MFTEVFLLHFDGEEEKESEIFVMTFFFENLCVENILVSTNRSRAAYQITLGTVFLCLG